MELASRSGKLRAKGSGSSRRARVKHIPRLNRLPIYHLGRCMTNPGHWQTTQTRTRTRRRRRYRWKHPSFIFPSRSNAYPSCGGALAINAVHQVLDLPPPRSGRHALPHSSTAEPGRARVLPASTLCRCSSPSPANRIPTPPLPSSQQAGPSRPKGGATANLTRLVGSPRPASL